MSNSLSALASARQGCRRDPSRRTAARRPSPVASGLGGAPVAAPSDAGRRHGARLRKCRPPGASMRPAPRPRPGRRSAGPARCRRAQSRARGATSQPAGRPGRNRRAAAPGHRIRIGRLLETSRAASGKHVHNLPTGPLPPASQPARIRHLPPHHRLVGRAQGARATETPGAVLPAC